MDLNLGGILGGFVGLLLYLAGIFAFGETIGSLLLGKSGAIHGIAIVLPCPISIAVFAAIGNRAWRRFTESRDW
jgi:hypothetical protein